MTERGLERTADDGRHLATTGARRRGVRATVRRRRAHSTTDDAGDDGCRSVPTTPGPLPHWTEPPTGEMPRSTDPDRQSVRRDGPTDDLDVWSSFAAKAPVWQDDEPVDPHGDDGRPHRASSGGPPRVDEQWHDVTSRRRDLEPAAPRAGPHHDRHRSDRRPAGRPCTPAAAAARRPRSGRRRLGPHRSAGARRRGRDMPTAIAVGLLIAAVFIAACSGSPLGVLVVVAVVSASAAIEFFDKVTEKGYRPATSSGIVACVATPLAAYWVGERRLPLVVAFGVRRRRDRVHRRRSVESGPMPNMASPRSASCGSACSARSPR